MHNYSLIHLPNKLNFLFPSGVAWREEGSRSRQHPQEGAAKAKEPDVK